MIKCLSHNTQQANQFDDHIMTYNLAIIKLTKSQPDLYLRECSLEVV